MRFCHDADLLKGTPCGHQNAVWSTSTMDQSALAKHALIVAPHTYTHTISNVLSYVNASTQSLHASPHFASLENV